MLAVVFGFMIRIRGVDEGDIVTDVRDETKSD